LNRETYTHQHSEIKTYLYYSCIPLAISDKVQRMEEKIIKGMISFVNYEKNFATIEYGEGSKKKSVNCKTDAAATGKKPHQFKIGDQVSFQLKLSDRGDKMTAYNVRFLHNTAISLLIQKAAIENRFSGYLKKVDDKYFVKEWESYIIFPIQLSPWEKPPVETAENEAITFKLLNTDKPKNIVAELFSHNYIPEFRKAMQHFKDKTAVEAVVNKILPHAVYFGMFNNTIQAKLQFSDPEKNSLKEGDKIPVQITHLTTNRIVIEKAKTE
jgi:hypothetical protein